MRLIALWLGWTCAFAQSDAVAPAFDVASFNRQPVNALRRGWVQHVTPDSVTFHGASLGNCIDWAYGYDHFHVIGPAWRDYPTDVIYDVTAKSAGPAEPSQLRLMFQSLLEERLGLAFHREQRDLPVYALVVARNGPKFHQSATEGEKSITYPKFWVKKFERVTMAQFIETIILPFSSRYVVDETGLTGTFDFTLDLARYVLDAGTGKPLADSLGRVDDEKAYLQALPEQLGLRLERKTAASEVLVIDHVEKDPTAN